MRRAFVVLLAGTLVLGSCSSSDSPRAVSADRLDDAAPAGPADTAATPDTEPEAAEASPAPTGPTPWSDAVEAYDFEAEPNVDAALTLFTMALGPIDGLPEPPPDAGAAGDVTVAMRAVLGVWDQLTAAQRDAVTAARRGETPPTASGLRAPTTRTADPTLVAAITDAAHDLRAQIAGRIGDFPAALRVIVAERNDADEDLGVASPDVLPDGSYSPDCEVTIFPKATTEVYKLLNTIAHEVFHCFQLTALGTVGAYTRAPGWVVEGGAEWVGATLTQPDDTTPGRWTGWFDLAGQSLALKKYTAIGFWSHLAESGTDPWGVFRTVWAVSTSTPAAFTASGANGPAFIDSWASGMTRRPGFPPGWDTTGPGITDDSIETSSLEVPSPGQQSASTLPFTTKVLEVTSSADVLVFSGTHARVSDGTVDVVDPVGSRFCHRDGGCACPGRSDDVPPAPIGQPTVALTGATDGASITVVGLTLEQDCEERDQKAVMVTAERPASEGVLAGEVLHFVSCNGAYGDWTGVLRLGGLSLDGFEVAWQELPVSFTVGGTGVRTVQATTSGVITTPVFDIAVGYDLAITIDGTTMSIDGTATGETDMFSVGGAFPSELSGLPIVDAPDGTCPDA